MRRRSDDRGQAIVEFALVVPIITALAIGIVVLGQIGAARILVANAAVQGARVGALTNDDELIRDAVAAAADELPGDAVDVEIRPAASDEPRSSNPRGTVLRVDVAYALPFRALGFPRLVVKASAAHVMEWTP